MDALPGRYGDEGPRLLASLDQMEAALRRWDAGLRGYESGIREQLRGAQPSIAAALRMPLGAVYLERGRFDDALREFEEAARLEPKRADIQVFRALAYQAANQASQAASAFRSAWEVDPSDPVTSYFVARDELRAGHPAEAGAALQTLLTFQQSQNEVTGRRSPFVIVSLVDESRGNEPEFAPALYADGFTLIRQGKYEDAVVRFRQAVSADPLSADRAAKTETVQRGIAALREGRIDAAIRELKTAVEMNGDSSEIHRCLGTAYGLDHQYGASIEQFEAAIRLRPTDERSRLALAEVLVESGQRDRAEQALRDAIEAIPRSGAARWNLGQILQTLFREEDSLPAFEEAASFPTLAGADRIQTVVGTLYLRRTDFDRAIVAFRRRLDGDPNSAVAHRELGDAYRQQGGQGEAMLEYLATLLIDPADAEAYAAIGQIHLAAGRYDVAIEILRRAVNLKPQHKEARYALANALVRVGRMDEGRRELEVVGKLQAEALEEEHRSYELNQLKLEGNLRFNEGKYEESVLLWKQVVDRQPEVPANHASLAQALANGGHHEAAIESFERALGVGAELELHRSIAEEHEKLGDTEAAERERNLYRQLRQEQLRQLGTRQ